MKVITVYEAEDGTRFETPEEAARYEFKQHHANALADLLHRFDGRCWDEGGGLAPEALARTLAESPRAAAEMISALKRIHGEGEKS